jgi:hypothetical protein
MGMWVMFEFLIPGVEHTEETDLSAEMLGIASDLEEGFGTGLQQQMVEDFLVLQGERCQLRRQGEDDMDVGRGEQFAPSSLDPAFASARLTLWAMAIATANGELSISCLMGSLF